jgi:hypothetical protein
VSGGCAVSREEQLALSDTGLTHVAAGEVLKCERLEIARSMAGLEFLHRLACSVSEASQMHVYGDPFNVKLLGRR